MKFVFSVVRIYYRPTTFTPTCLRSFCSSGSKSSSFKGKSRKTTWSPSPSPTPNPSPAHKAAKELNCSPAPAVTSFPLTEQQSQALNIVSAGESVFITGSAGTGKTILLKHVIEILTQIHGSKHVFVTASTGVAACALSGMTLHSFAGIGLGTADRETLLLTAASKKDTYRRWRRAKALVIDEVSMVDADLFDNLEYIARGIRANHKNRVWGGIQLIVCGDFFQLPPVSLTTNGSSKSNKEFAFEAECWNASFDQHIELTQIFRQSDTQLINLLHGIRRGFNDRKHLQLLNTRLVESEPDPFVIRLFPMKQDLKRVNDERLRSLGQEIYTYTALDVGRQPWKSQLNLGVALDKLELCLGARVMLLKNFDPSCGLVNGATGKIRGFKKYQVTDISDSGLLPIVEFDSGQEMVISPDRWDVTQGKTVFATRRQLPLIPAWALSIHKCQGMTLDSLHTDLSRAFGCGMVYVALSRVRSLDGLHLSGFDSSKIKAHPKVLEFYQNLFGCQS
ncbi:ATP-dependent DNA helicase PIF1-like [Macadamia integrifolia]|uniref:ATP-dependent DNA helicase PIF1-like n=1 Tax=Macadamia integrifolia TaxID=60698 RepID=UPI001C4F9598|nr:ATP-dependent DNA helicase PIF1-like [Macadamia integrifolia]